MLWYWLELILSHVLLLWLVLLIYKLVLTLVYLVVPLTFLMLLYLVRILLSILPLVLRLLSRHLLVLVVFKLPLACISLLLVIWRVQLVGLRPEDKVIGSMVLVVREESLLWNVLRVLPESC